MKNLNKKPKQPWMTFHDLKAQYVKIGHLVNSLCKQQAHANVAAISWLAQSTMQLAGILAGLGARTVGEVLVLLTIRLLTTNC